MDPPGRSAPRAFGRLYRCSAGDQPGGGQIHGDMGNCGFLRDTDKYIKDEK